MYVPILMYKLISVSHAHKRKFKVVNHNDLDDSNSRSNVLIHERSGDVNMISIEAKDGLYEALISVNTVYTRRKRV